MVSQGLGAELWCVCVGFGDRYQIPCCGSIAAWSLSVMLMTQLSILCSVAHPKEFH